MQEWRLSVLQQLMRESSALAPYNFIHAMRLPSAPRAERWQAAVSTASRELGISSQISVEQIATNLEQHLQSELERPFARADAPLRFFLNSAVDGYWFGVVLDHWFADDFSGRVLMQRLYQLYYEEEPRMPVPLQRRATVLRRRRPWVEWFTFLQEFIRLRRAARPPLVDPLDFSVGIFRRTFPETSLVAGQTVAKKLGVKLHDLFLAATAQALGRRHRVEPGSRRDAIALVSAMNARRFAHERDHNVFDLVLGQYIVVERKPDELSFPELGQRIANQTTRMKTGVGTELFGPALLLWRLADSRRAKATFFRRGAPFAAGLSNVNLSGSWTEAAEIKDYRRVGPTGVIVPMLLMITTFRGRIFADVTFRRTSFTATEAENVVDDVINRFPC